MNLPQIVGISLLGLCCLLLDVLNHSIGFCFLWLLGLGVFGVTMASHWKSEYEKLQRKQGRGQYRP